jgi:hypothetical protein
MNKQQLDIQLVEWLKKFETETQNEFMDLQTTRRALEGNFQFEGDVKKHLEDKEAFILHRFHWLRKQMDEINLTF